MDIFLPDGLKYNHARNAQHVAMYWGCCPHALCPVQSGVPQYRPQYSVVPRGPQKEAQFWEAPRYLKPRTQTPTTHQDAIFGV